MRISYLLLLAFIALLSCEQAQNKNKFTNYYNQGKQLYTKHCSNCHQPNGTGLGRVYPPLHQSDYMNTNFESVICLMKNGIDGKLMVNGKEYNQPMPGIPALTDLEIAEIATYIYNTWEHQRGLVDVSEVSRVLRNCP
jgi:mono/diheme cytochrome c family protein